MHRRRHGRGRALRGRLTRLLAWVFLAAASPGAAALDKCTGPDGKVTYSDHGCAAAAKHASVGDDTSGAGVEVEYYDVAAPSGHHGTAFWNLSYKYTARVPREGGCAVDKLTTVLGLKMRMPRWTRTSGASGALMSHWQRYLAALQVHEQGHLQHGRDFERAFLAASRGLRAESCGALSALLRARFDELLEQARRRDVDYDTQTRHGATQGAVF